MSENRIPKKLFTDDQHFLGRPADFDDKIVHRRLNLLRKIKGFCGKEFELLDIGCGNGASMFLLSNEFKSCTGFEITDEHLMAFNTFKSQNDILNCHFEIVDIENEPVKKQYDRIISFEVIEHLRDDKHVKFYYDSLKKGGLMAISVPNKWWVFETHGANLPLLPWNRVPLFSWLPKPIHEKFANARIYTKNRITKLLRNTGFEIIDAQYITAPMDVLKEGKLKSFLIKNIFNQDTTNIPFKSTAIFVVAKKI